MAEVCWRAKNLFKDTEFVRRKNTKEDTLETEDQFLADLDFEYFEDYESSDNADNEQTDD